MILKRLFKDTLVYGGADFLLRFLSFATFPLLAYALSVEEFGVMALLLTVGGLLNTFANLGLNNALQRFYWDPQTPEADRPGLVSTGLLLQVLVTLALTLLSLLVLWPLRDLLWQRYQIPWLSLCFVVLSLLPGNLLVYATDVIRLHFTPWRFLLLSLLKNGLHIALTLLWVIAFKGRLDGYFFGALLAGWLAVPIALWLIRQEFSLKLNMRFVKDLVSYGYPFIFVALAAWIFSSLDRWMLGELSSSTEIGYFAVASKFASIPLFVSSAFGLAWSPITIRLVAEAADYRRQIGQVLTVWLYLITVICGALMLSARELLVILTPNEYHQAATTLIFLTMGTLWQATTQITAFGISLEKQTHHFARITWLTAAVNLGLNLVLIPRFGAMGAAQATLVSQLLVTGLYLWLTQKLHPLELETNKLLGVLLIMLATLALALITEAVNSAALRDQLWSSSWQIILLKSGWLLVLLGLGPALGILSPRALLGLFRPQQS
ncbi:MAG: flippase [Candidatus Melainabacteria bacterium HGW-Melainabacteria-1]|nr:MAG: flippase [Candidatus Melainabacteria bacterium HGW-Melainabacteria-1]